MKDSKFHVMRGWFGKKKNTVTDPQIDPRIVAFIGRHHVLTLATAVDCEPWCANMFYAWLDDPGCFVFTSDDATRHVADALVNKNIAGSVVLETRVIGRLQGLQFRGVMHRTDDAPEIVAEARKAYLKRFPYAAAMRLNLWMIRPTYLKFTDNRLGFGKKLIWPQNPQQET